MQDYSKLKQAIGIEIKNVDLYNRAFIHRSYVNECRDPKVRHNERLEFLGDAVLELVATKHLFEVCPDQNEGELTAFRAALVKGKHLAEIGEELNLGQYLMLSKGEEKSGGRHKNYILANTVEALIGAIYLDHGYKAAEDFIEKFILAKLDEIIEKGLHIDAKSRFQELCQEKEGFTPYYEMIESQGPDHKKEFVMGVFLHNELIAQGVGSSKQKAEEEAAQAALAIKGWTMDSEQKFDEKSCGVILYRDQDGERYYLLLQYLGKHWDFVKGHVEDGESEEQTVRRELEEETGIEDLKIFPGYREQMSYRYTRKGKLSNKQVIYFVGKTNTEKIILSHEHLDYKWLPYSEALKRLTFENARSLLSKAKDFLEEKD